MEPNSLEVFYDGSCRFCTRQAARLRQLDSRRQFRLTNLEAEPFAPEIYDIRVEDARARVHGADQEGNVYSSFNLVLEIMRRLGYKKLSYAFGLPVIKQFGALAFNVFSRYRVYF
jgi:predicted DCC family thiol-disulfide oxidoreductase YuxK